MLKISIILGGCPKGSAISKALDAKKRVGATKKDTVRGKCWAKIEMKNPYWHPRNKIANN